MNQSTLLQEIGLSQKEATIYQLMLELGQTPAKTIIAKTSMPRGTVYEILDQLVQKGLLEQYQNEKNLTVFRAKHPYALKEYIESQKQKMTQTEIKLESLFEDFTKLFHQSQQRPGVKFFEGMEGVKKALKDSLTSKTEILTVADIEATVKFINEINEEYVRERNKEKIPKRLLAVDNAFSRERYKAKKNLLDVRLLKISIQPFNTSLQIYDDKIAYITMNEKGLTATIIENPFIYSMHRALFEILWERSEKIGE